MKPAVNSLGMPLAMGKGESVPRRSDYSNWSRQRENVSAPPSASAKAASHARKSIQS